MNRQKIKIVLDELTAEIDTIEDKKAITIIKVLVNLVEMLAEENEKLREDNQKLRDEINRMKGEQGKPNIREQSAGRGNSSHSSEEDRKKRQGKNKNKGKGKKNINIDRCITIPLDKTELPNDVQFKGYETRTIQDLKIISDNIEFKLETYYSPSLKKTFIAPIPVEYQGGEFGPKVKALVITLYRDSGMTEPAIRRLLKTFGIQISHGKISSLLTEEYTAFHQEKEDILDAGLQASPYQNHYTHVLCNDYFTAYFTRHKKDRLTLLDLLCRGQLKFLLDQKAMDLMIEFGLANTWQDCIKSIMQPRAMTRSEMDEVLNILFPDPKKHGTNRRIVLESAALAYYQQSKHFIRYLITDDAPQFNLLALHHALCWVHEGRHYKKLNPFSAINRKILDAFLERFWDYYQALLTYKKAPSEEVANQLSLQFDELFSTITGYDALDQLTRTKKTALLLVLMHPFLPLHNNGSELGTRVQARMRDINFQTVSENGTKSKDTFSTIVQTARKLGVNIYDYIYDRVARIFKMPSLAETILLKAGLIPDPA